MAFLKDIKDLYKVWASFEFRAWESNFLKTFHFSIVFIQTFILIYLNSWFLEDYN